jgi:hypothetical protein
VEKVNKKTPIVFYVGIVLLGLVIISSYFTNGLYARYAVSEFSYDDARIASFDVNIVSGVNLYSELIELGEIQPGDESSISFTVNNNSEVAVALNITAINLTGNLPIDVPLKGMIAADSPIFSETLDSGDTATFTFAITWDKNNSNPAAAGKTDILELRIAVEQVD